MRNRYLIIKNKTFLGQGSELVDTHLFTYGEQIVVDPPLVSFIKILIFLFPCRYLFTFLSTLLISINTHNYIKTLIIYLQIIPQAIEII